MFLATYVISLLQAYGGAIRHSELTWISVNVATYLRPPATAWHFTPVLGQRFF